MGNEPVRICHACGGQGSTAPGSASMGLCVLGFIPLYVLEQEENSLPPVRHPCGIPQGLVMLLPAAAPTHPSHRDWGGPGEFAMSKASSLPSPP